MIRSATQPRSAGFTFIEVLFAIIILGIGSILLAGMLPVAIKQSADTRNEITGRAVCEAGFAYVQAAAAVGQYAMGDSNLVVVPAPAPGPSVWRVVPLTSAVLTNGANVGNAAAPGPIYALRDLTGSRVWSSDPRFQWTAFYGRDPGGYTAKLIVLATRLQNTEATDRYNATTLTNADNAPKLLGAVFTEGGALDADTVALTGNAQTLAAADTGAFVIVATQTGTAANADPERNNGRVFRLGQRRTDLESTPATEQFFELQPGYDLPPRFAGNDGKMNTADDVADATLGSSSGTSVWIVGRGLRNPTAAYNATGNPVSGSVQDIAVLQVNVPVAR